MRVNWNQTWNGSFARMEWEESDAAAKRNVLRGQNGTQNLIQSARKRRKLSEEEVKAVRKLLSEGVSQCKIAEQYGVSQPVISYVNTRTTYKDVE